MLYKFLKTFGDIQEGGTIKLNEGVKSETQSFFSEGTIIYVSGIQEDLNTFDVYIITGNNDSIHFFTMCSSGQVKMLDYEIVKQNNMGNTHIEFDRYNELIAGYRGRIKKLFRIDRGIETTTYPIGCTITINKIVKRGSSLYVRDSKAVLIPIDHVEPLSSSTQGEKSKDAGKKIRFCFALRDSDENLIGYKSGLLMSLSDNCPKHYVERINDNGKFNIYEPFDELVEAAAEGNYDDDSMLSFIENSLYERIKNKLPNKKVREVFPLKISLDFPEKRNNYVKKGRVKWEININGVKTNK